MLCIYINNCSLLKGNDLLEYSPYEPVNSRLSDIFRLAPIIAGKKHFSSCEYSCSYILGGVQSQVQMLLLHQSKSPAHCPHLSLWDNGVLLSQSGFKLQLSTPIIHHKKLLSSHRDLPPHTKHSHSVRFTFGSPSVKRAACFPTSVSALILDEAFTIWPNMPGNLSSF